MPIFFHIWFLSVSCLSPPSTSSISLPLPSPVFLPLPSPPLPVSSFFLHGDPPLPASPPVPRGARIPSPPWLSSRAAWGCGRGGAAQLARRRRGAVAGRARRCTEWWRCTRFKHEKVTLVPLPSLRVFCLMLQVASCKCICVIEGLGVGYFARNAPLNDNWGDAWCWIADW